MKFANSKSERGRNFRTRYTTISYFIRLIRLIYNYDFIAKIDLKRVDNKVELTIIFNDVLCTIILYNHFHNNYNIISWLICVYYNYKIQYANFSTDILIGIKATWWHVTHAHSFSLFCSFCFSVVSVTEQQIDTTRQVRDRSQVLPSTVLPQGDFSHRTLFFFRDRAWYIEKAFGSCRSEITSVPPRAGIFAMVHRTHYIHNCVYTIVRLWELSKSWLN